MKKILAHGFILLFFTVMSYAQEKGQIVDASSLRSGWCIGFLEVPDDGEDSENEYSLSMFFFPKKDGVNMNKMTNQNTQYVDNYSFNNSPPIVSTIFYENKGASKYAIVLVKWHISALGADTLADYYQIFAYKLTTQGAVSKLSKDEKITKQLGEGYDGQVDGKVVRFKLKTVDKIRRKFELL
jgi:hypothetical protein